MNYQDTIVIYPSTSEQTEAIKAFVKALKIKFELNKEKPYNPEFVAKIKKGEQDLKNGKGIVMSLAELEVLCK
jgi:hypothetical protein